MVCSPASVARRLFGCSLLTAFVSLFLVVLCDYAPAQSARHWPNDRLSNQLAAKFADNRFWLTGNLLANTRLANNPPLTSRLLNPPAPSRLVYSSINTANNKKQIYAINADGTGRTNLSSSPTTDDTDPALSPNGGKIAFSRNGLSLMNADGSGQVTRTNAYIWVADVPSWSPDNSKIVFKDWGATPDLFVINADGTGRTQITSNADHEDWMTWSPDGTKIAFVKGNSVYTINPNGTGQTLLWTGSYQPSNLFWSPNGQSLAWTGWYTSELIVINANGSNLMTLSVPLQTPGALSWSADSTKIAYSGNHYTNDWGDDVFVINASGGTATKLTTFTHLGGDRIRNIAWSPDGAQIAFAYMVTPGSSGTSNLYVMNADGSGLVNIGQEPTDNIRLLWSARINQAPTVSITAPVNNASYAPGSNVTINATAADADGTIAKVEFYQGATKLGEDTTSPYSFAWNNVTTGNYVLTAKAVDNGGAVTTSSVINVAVYTNTPPTVSITAPTNSTSVIAGSNITINASAADTTGSVSKVEFFQGATKLGEDVTAPYSFVWNSVVAGSYALTAKATDNNNAATTSSAVNLTVYTNAPPTVSLTAPANNASFVTNSNVTINASASDATGTVSKVEFYQGAAKLGEDTTSPYSYVWNNVTAGNYVLTAKATDNHGAITTSTAINITVVGGTITGKVTKFGTATAIIGATVKIYQGMATAGTVVTDSAGNYSQGSLTAGTYLVEAAAAGYRIKTEVNTAVTVGAVSTVNFALEPDPGPIVYSYDDLGRLSSVVDPAGNTGIYKYDPNGNLLAILNSSSNAVAITGFSPASGRVGTSVRIDGTKFSPTPGLNTVKFNGVTATVTAASINQITVTVPGGATTGTITVTAPAGTATSAAAFTVNTSNAPTITAISPSTGVSDTAVTITGTNFQTVATNNRVTFNRVPVYVNSATATSISAVVPGGAGSGKFVVATPFGQAASSDFIIAPTGYPSSDIVSTGRINFGETKTVAVNTANKVGLLFFDGAAGQPVNLKIGSATIPGITDLKIYQPNGTLLPASTIVINGNTVIDAEALPATGTYTLLVDPPGTGTGSISLTLSNSVTQTGTITAGGNPLTVTTITPGQDARITFAGTAGQKVSLQMSGNTMSGSGNIFLHKPDGTRMTGGNGYVNYLEAQLPVAGTYTVLVETYSATAVGSLTLKLNNVTDVTGTITIDGAPVTVTTTTPGQDIRLTVSGTGPDVYLYLSSNNFPGVGVSVRQPNNTLVLNTSVAQNNTEFLEFRAAAGYIIVLDPGSGVGGITLKLANQPPELTANITPNGGPITVTTTQMGQNVRLRFSGTDGQQASLSVSNVTIPGSTFISLYEPNGGSPTLVRSTRFYPGSSTDTGAINGATLPSNGPYTIFVDPSKESVGNITFSLSVNDPPPDVTASITPNGSPVTIATTQPGQKARLTFAGTAGQQVNLSVSNITIPGLTYLYLFGVAGEYLAIGTYNQGPGTGGIHTATLPVSGTYTILVDPEAAYTGGITVSLTSP